jgi:hypothetical protein
MYGYHGYATNAYGSDRQTTLAPVVKLAMRIAATGYNATITVISGIFTAALLNPYNVLPAIMLRFRNLVLSNPSTNQNTLEL